MRAQEPCTVFHTAAIENAALSESEALLSGKPTKTEVREALIQDC